jgi:hypothetical protein
VPLGKNLVHHEYYVLIKKTPKPKRVSSGIHLKSQSLGRMSQENYKFKASLGYIVRCCLKKIKSLKRRVSTLRSLQIGGK